MVVAHPPHDRHSHAATGELRARTRVWVQCGQRTDADCRHSGAKCKAATPPLAERTAPVEYAGVRRGVHLNYGRRDLACTACRLCALDKIICFGEASKRVSGGAEKQTNDGNWLPQWVMDLFHEFINHHEAVGRVLHLSIEGISGLRFKYELFQILDENGGDPNKRKRLEEAAKERDLAQNEIDNDFPLLHEQATVAVWSSLEALMRSFVALWLENTPDAWQSEAIRRLKVRLGEYESLDRSDRCLWVVELLDQDNGGPLRSGVNRFELLLEPLGLSGSLDEATKKTLFELSHVRHALVHRRGFVDRKLREACPWLSVPHGQKLQVSHAMWRSYADAVACYVAEVINRVRMHFGLGRRDFARAIEGPAVSKEATLGTTIAE